MLAGGASARAATQEEDTMIGAILASGAAEGSEHASSLPMSPMAYGFGTLGAFLALLIVTWAFRSVGTRH